VITGIVATASVHGDSGQLVRNKRGIGDFFRRLVGGRKKTPVSFFLLISFLII